MAYTVPTLMSIRLEIVSNICSLCIGDVCGQLQNALDIIWRCDSSSDTIRQQSGATCMSHVEGLLLKRSCLIVINYFFKLKFHCSVWQLHYLIEEKGAVQHLS